MAIAAVAERSPSQSVKTEHITEGNGLGILQSARYALRWNTPEVATTISLKYQARVTELKGQTEIGSPTEKAETRYILAKALEDVTRLRRLGLASGTDQEESPGMIFAVPLDNTKSEEEPTAIHYAPVPKIGDGDTSFQWWYLPRAEIEKAIDLSYKNQTSKPNIDNYVFRAAMGFIVSEDGRGSPSSDQIHSVDLDPIAASGLMRVAKDMKNNGLHGRIPSRTETRTREILHSGSFPDTNILTFSAGNQTLNEEKARSA